MMLAIPRGNEDASPGTMPDAEGVEKMMAYNEELREAGVLLALDGLRPPSTGFRVTYPGGKPTVTDEIARACLVPSPTLGQRIVRAKRTLREANVPFELPPDRELPERLGSVLEVIYLVLNEGYAATSGDRWVRPELCRDALRLGRVLAGLAPDEPEVHGLVALMELQASRLGARVGTDGEAVLLMDQDRARWDRLHIGRGLDALDRAQRPGGALGPYALQAAIAACHARSASPEDTDWERITALYDALAQLMPSPIVELNRAVAVGRAFGPDAGLSVIEALDGEKALEGYHLLPAVRGDLLERAGRAKEARAAFARAAPMTDNERERAVLLERARLSTGARARGVLRSRRAKGCPAFRVRTDSGGRDVPGVHSGREPPVPVNGPQSQVLRVLEPEQGIARCVILHDAYPETSVVVDQQRLDRRMRPRPARSSPSMRTELSTENPPVPYPTRVRRVPRMSAAVAAGKELPDPFYAGGESLHNLRSRTGGSIDHIGVECGGGVGHVVAGWRPR